MPFLKTIAFSFWTILATKVVIELFAPELENASRGGLNLLGNGPGKRIFVALAVAVVFGSCTFFTGVGLFILAIASISAAAFGKVQAWAKF